jgi:TonB family protein
MAIIGAPSQNELTSPPVGNNGGYRRREGAPLHDAPALLIQLQDDLSRSRMREAFWISLLVHLALILLIVNMERLIPRRSLTVFTQADLMKNRDLTYLELPPDVQKITKPPDTNILSDKNRIATSRKPTLDRDQLRKILDSGRPGTPGPGGIRAPKSAPAATQPAQQPAQTAQSQAPPSQQNQQQGPATEQKSDQQISKLQPPAGAAPPHPFGAGVSPGAALEQAARAAAASRGGYGGSAGDYGLGVGRPKSSIASDLDVLSDTMGVDFGPYLSRVLHDVRINWYNLIPEVARAPLMKKGKVSIEFAITKDGHVAGMRLVSPSGDVSLDRAALGGITSSNPFPPLPTEFRGDYLALRFHFFYNPDKNDLQ